MTSSVRLKYRIICCLYAISKSESPLRYPGLGRLSDWIHPPTPTPRQSTFHRAWTLAVYSFRSITLSLLGIDLDLSWLVDVSIKRHCIGIRSTKVRTGSILLTPYRHSYFECCYPLGMTSPSYIGSTFPARSISLLLFLRESPLQPNTLSMNPAVSLINHPCMVCFKSTSMWCSRCQNVWYCSPEHLQSVSQ